MQKKANRTVRRIPSIECDIKFVVSMPQEGTKNGAVAKKNN